MTTKTTSDLEAIYQKGMVLSHQDALKAVYEAGALDALADSKARANASETPQQQQTEWTDTAGSAV